jgi:hypothetical protein
MFSTSEVLCLFVEYLGKMTALNCEVVLLLN